MARDEALKLGGAAEGVAEGGVFGEGVVRGEALKPGGVAEGGSIVLDLEVKCGALWLGGVASSEALATGRELWARASEWGLGRADLRMSMALCLTVWR